MGTEYELPHSWNEMLFNHGIWGTGWNAFFGYADGTNRQGKNKQVKPYEKGNVDDDGYPDGLTAGLAEKKLRELSAQNQPFFLAVGFFKPHLPFTAPAKYWDLYDEGRIPLTPAPGLPENVNPASLHESGEFNGYLAGEEDASLEKPLSDAYARKIRHAYFACISYVDAQIGRLLNELERLGLAENTIVVVWGDHGWHLGDERVWGKHTIFDWALRSTLIMKVPGNRTKGQKVDAIVSSVDIYPTLMELCGIDMPLQTDGKSRVTLLKGKNISGGDDVAFSYFRNGISLRTSRYRLTRYFRTQEPATELYDYSTDPYETRNIAAEHAALVNQLMTLWEKGNTGLYPE